MLVLIFAMGRLQCCLSQVSKAHAMLDEARLLVERRVPPALAARCEEIHAAGGLGPPPPGAMPDVLPPAAEATRQAFLPDANLDGRSDRWVPAVSLAGTLSYQTALLVIVSNL